MLAEMPLDFCPVIPNRLKIISHELSDPFCDPSHEFQL